MGIFKFLVNLFKCESSCAFNRNDLPEDMLDIDLSLYKLKDSDLKVIKNIMEKRPSIVKHKHLKLKNHKTII